MNTAIDEVAPNVFRISTGFSTPDGGFSFNQYLIASEEPVLWHTGPRAMFELTRGAIARVLDPAGLRYIGFSHVEADEMGALNQFLAIAPNAQPMCGRIAAMTSVVDMADRAPRVLADGEVLDAGGARLRWIDAPHLPHGWETGLIHDEASATLFCGDLFTQQGAASPPVTEGDILGPSEAFRGVFDYYAHGPDTRARLNALADLAPQTLACMHGSAYRGDCAGLLRALGEKVG